jgi:hypothetical protein
MSNNAVDEVRVIPSMLEDFEVVAATRRAWIEQARKDEALRLRLERERRAAPDRLPGPKQQALF